MCQVSARQPALVSRWTALVSSCGQMTMPASSPYWFSSKLSQNDQPAKFATRVHNKLFEFELQMTLKSEAFWHISSVSPFVFQTLLSLQHFVWYNINYHKVKPALTSDRVSFHSEELAEDCVAFMKTHLLLAEPVLAGMELTFVTAGLMVVCLGLVTKTVLITHLCFGCC